MKKIFLFLCAVFMAAPIAALAETCEWEHCADCSGVFSCSACEDGYVLNHINSNCYKITPIEHCADYFYYKNDVQCQKCENGWIGTSYYNTKVCNKNTVEHCNAKNETDIRKEQETGLKQCSQCEGGYGLYKQEGKDTQCVPCEDKNARTCFTPDNSDWCKYGYSLGDDAQGSGNRYCFKNIANCAEYKGVMNTSGWCSKCQDGYTLSADKTSCVKGTICPENATCSGKNVTCNSGYGLQNGMCVKITCPANCSACSSATTCTTCAAGYSLIGGECVEGTVAQCPSDSTMSSDGCCCIPK